MVQPVWYEAAVRVPSEGVYRYPSPPEEDWSEMRVYRRLVDEKIPFLALEVPNKRKATSQTIAQRFSIFQSKLMTKYGLSENAAFNRTYKKFRQDIKDFEASLDLNEGEMKELSVEGMQEMMDKNMNKMLKIRADRRKSGMTPREPSHYDVMEDRVRFQQKDSPHSVFHGPELWRLWREVGDADAELRLEGEWKELFVDDRSFDSTKVPEQQIARLLHEQLKFMQFNPPRTGSPVKAMITELWKAARGETNELVGLRVYPDCTVSDVYAYLEYRRKQIGQPLFAWQPAEEFDEERDWAEYVAQRAKDYQENYMTDRYYRRQRRTQEEEEARKNMWENWKRRKLDFEEEFASRMRKMDPYAPPRLKKAGDPELRLEEMQHRNRRVVELSMLFEYSVPKSMHESLRVPGLHDLVEPFDGQYAEEDMEWDQTADQLAWDEFMLLKKGLYPLQTPRRVHRQRNFNCRFNV